MIAQITLVKYAYFSRLSWMNWNHINSSDVKEWWTLIMQSKCSASCSEDKSLDSLKKQDIIYIELV